MPSLTNRSGCKWEISKNSDKFFSLVLMCAQDYAILSDARNTVKCAITYSKIIIASFERAYIKCGINVLLLIYNLCGYRLP